MSSRETALILARRAGQLALSKKAFDVRILNLTDISTVCDYFVVASGSADIQVKAIADAVEDGLREDGHKALHREGKKEGTWILLDYVDVIVHVFHEPTRQYYALEKLWGDAPFEDLVDR